MKSNDKKNGRAFSAVPVSNESNNKFLRAGSVVGYSFLLCAIMSVMLYLYCTKCQDIFTDIENAKHSMPQFLWVVKHVINLLPVPILTIILWLTHRHNEKSRSYYLHKEQLIESICAMLFTFLVLLPYIVIKSKSGEIPDAEETEEVITLLDKTLDWFVVQFIPFTVLIMYHHIRGKRICE